MDRQEYFADYRQRNRERLRQESARRYADPVYREKHKSDSRKRNWKRKMQALEAYGRVCACCGEDRPEFLALDHIHGGGNQKRKKGQLAGTPLYKALRLQGYPQGEFRVLCHNCNLSLGFYGYCPHQGVAHV